MNFTNSNNDEAIAIKGSSKGQRLDIVLNSYINELNRKYIPLFKQLSLNVTIKDIVRYCTKGGYNRLKSDYLNQLGASVSPILCDLAEKHFASILMEFGEYQEFLADWDAISVLKLDDSGLLTFDEDGLQKRMTVYLKEKDAIDTYKTISQICEFLNKTVSPTLTNRFDILDRIIYYDTKEDKFCISNSWMDDESLCEIKYGSAGMARYDKKKPDWYLRITKREQKEKDERWEKIKKSFNL